MLYTGYLHLLSYSPLESHYIEIKRHNHCAKLPNVNPMSNLNSHIYNYFDGVKYTQGGLDSGDTAWMLTSTALVLLMTMPGLAIYYSGMVRDKNVLACKTGDTYISFTILKQSTIMTLHI